MGGVGGVGRGIWVANRGLSKKIVCSHCLRAVGVSVAR